MANATYDPSGALLDGGIDLNMENGMAEYELSIHIILFFKTIDIKCFTCTKTTWQYHAFA